MAEFAAFHRGQETDLGAIWGEVVQVNRKV